MIQRHISDKMSVTGDIPKEFKCEYCDKSYQHKGRLLAHTKKIHMNNIVEKTTATKPATTMASKPDMTLASEPADASKPAQNITAIRQKKTVWKIVPNLTTQEVNNLLEDEEEIINELNQLEHDVGINQSMADWHGVNFDSTFSKSGEFDGRLAETIGQINKCQDCEVNSKTIDKQRELLTKSDKMLQDRQKINKDCMLSNIETKKKLAEAVKLVEELTAENTHLKINLQVQKDLATALKLSMETTTGKSEKAQETPIEKTNDEGPLPAAERKCSKCNFTTKNRVLLEEHKNSHIPVYKCDFCKFTTQNKEVLVRHAEKHKQSRELQCNMCNHTTRNEESLKKHKESHMEKKTLKCDMCNFITKDVHLMQEHKESHKEQFELKCLMCGSIMPNQENFKKHMKRHKQELNIKQNVDYPMNVYSFKCDPCKASFRTNEDLMEHMFNIHLTQGHRDGSRFAKYTQPNCKNGPQCTYHSQDRCKYYHSLPPQRQQPGPVQEHQYRQGRQPRQERQPRQAPNSQWQEMQRRWPQHQRKQNEHTHAEAPRYRLPTWCQHDTNCLQGRFCVLRQDGDQGFTRWSPARRQ